MKKDIKSNLDVVQSLAPAARTASANGSGVDLQDYLGAMVVFELGAKTDGTHTPSVEESDDNSTFSAVAAADLLGSLSAMSANTVQRVGYIGSKRYIRAVMTVSGATTGALSSAVVVRGEPKLAPLS